jgi:hypothetical protein
VADRRWAGVLLGALLLACDEPNEGANGSPCLKNRDCASDRCVATTCQPKPAFGGAAEEGAAGETGSAGDGGAASE